VYLCTLACTGLTEGGAREAVQAVSRQCSSKVRTTSPSCRSCRSRRITRSSSTSRRCASRVEDCGPRSSTPTICAARAASGSGGYERPCLRARSASSWSSISNPPRRRGPPALLAWLYLGPREAFRGISGGASPELVTVGLWRRARTDGLTIQIDRVR